MVRTYSVWLRKGDTDILRDINLHVDRGEFVFLVGPSGAGKTSVLRLIHFDDFPTQGRVVVGDHDSATIRPRQIPFARRKVGFVFQDFKLLRDRDVFGNVAFALEVTGARWARIRKKVTETLTTVGIGHKRNAMPDQLSGGEQQRVAIARALVHDPYLILADEPTGNLDPVSSRASLEVFQRINFGGTTILFATHQTDLVEMIPHRVVSMDQGSIVS
jgi:cell division transport system ATP-binding protein